MDAIAPQTSSHTPPLEVATDTATATTSIDTDRAIEQVSEATWASEPPQTREETMGNTTRSDISAGNARANETEQERHKSLSANRGATISRSTRRGRPRTRTSAHTGASAEQPTPSHRSTEELLSYAHFVLADHAKTMTEAEYKKAEKNQTSPDPARLDEYVTLIKEQSQCTDQCSCNAPSHEQRLKDTITQFVKISSTYPRARTLANALTHPQYMRNLTPSERIKAATELADVSMKTICPAATRVVAMVFLGQKSDKQSILESALTYESKQWHRELRDNQERLREELARMVDRALRKHAARSHNQKTEPDRSTLGDDTTEQVEQDPDSDPHVP